MLYPHENEILHPIVRQFMATDPYDYYVDDGEVCQFMCCMCQMRRAYVGDYM